MVDLNMLLSVVTLKDGIDIWHEQNVFVPQSRLSSKWSINFPLLSVQSSCQAIWMNTDVICSYRLAYLGWNLHNVPIVIQQCMLWLWGILDVIIDFPFHLFSWFTMSVLGLIREHYNVHRSHTELGSLTQSLSSTTELFSVIAVSDIVYPCLTFSSFFTLCFE